MTNENNKLNIDVLLDNIVPAFELNNIAIVTSSSDYYLPFVGVWLRSIIDHSSPQNNYDIIILQEGITELNKQILLSIAADAGNFSVRFVDVSSKLNTLNSDNWNHTTRLTFARFLIPEFFPGYSKALWLDGDIVAERDVADLFNIDIENYILAAVPEARAAGLYNRPDRAIRSDITQKHLVENVLEMVNPYDYFNAGVVLMNLDLFRKGYTSEDLIALGNRKDFVWLDQDAMNFISREGLYKLETPWNFTVTNVLCPEGHSEEPYAPESMYQDWLKASKNPWLVHYAGRQIPCFVPHSQLREYFWKYARKTPYYEQLIQRMIIEEINKAYINKDNEITELKEALLGLQNSLANLAANADNKAKKVEVPNFKFAQTINGSSNKKQKDSLFSRLINILLPKGSVRRGKAKKLYFKIRGWEYGEYG